MFEVGLWNGKDLELKQKVIVFILSLLRLDFK